MPTGPRRNPFDMAVVPGRPLAERITVPDTRSRSMSPRRVSDDEAARKGIDRYRPGGGHRNRSRSPLPPRRREGGRRPGTRREGGGRRGDRADRGERGERSERNGRDGRPKKTQEELDAEMEDYFNSNSGAAAANGHAAVDNEVRNDDIDMGIE